MAEQRVTVAVGQKWKSRSGREVLRLERCWEDGGVALVRGHPVAGGRPLVCPESHLIACYELVHDV